MGVTNSRRSTAYLLVAQVGFLVLLFLLTVAEAQAAVTLQYFVAVSGNQQVTLKWQTATELNNVGFYVQRSNASDGTYVRINQDIIPAQGDGLTGASYEYVDSNLTNGAQFWYRLETIDTGQHSDYSTPVSAVVGATATATVAPTSNSTSSPTNTITPSPTLTLTGQTQASTSTPSPRPSTATPTIASGERQVPAANTVYPGPNQPAALAPTSVQAPAPTSSALIATPEMLQDQSTGPTATLIPFPSVTIEFPPAANLDKYPLPTVAAGQNSLDLESLLHLWPLGLVIVAWVVLIGWFFLFRGHIK